MLFNSIPFIFVFLPITLFGFFQIRKKGFYKLSIAWLVAASLFFYGYWNPPYLVLILGSVLFNYSLGSALNNLTLSMAGRQGLLGFGIFCNLLAIGYFKYAGFLVSTINSMLSTQLILEEIALPLAISFFTFQQIAYLVDAYRQKTTKYTLLDYFLFVTFFPQLIAGPIVQHDDIIPQFSKQAASLFSAKNVALGITIFAMGLFKKVVFADGVAGYASMAFSEAGKGIPLTFLESWLGALAYTLQLYFDFSGYSDMAIGAAKIFGITLPLNFDSPYKAVNIVDFWRRWHITLSHFLRDYLYIPLGGNRRGEFQRSVNLMITMLLGGLWHGAGWVFVLWGGLHGLYLIINHQWHAFRKSLGHNIRQTDLLGRLIGQGITFFAVVIGWVFFRAETMPTALAMLSGMAGFHGISFGDGLQPLLGGLGAQLTGQLNIQFSGFLPNMLISPKNAVLSISLLLLVAWAAPNTQQWVSETNGDGKGAAAAKRTLGSEIAEAGEDCEPLGLRQRMWEQLRWRPSQGWAIVSAISTTVALLHLTRVSEFLYFEF